MKQINLTLILETSPTALKSQLTWTHFFTPYYTDGLWFMLHRIAEVSDGTRCREGHTEYGMGVVRMCVELLCVDHELSLSVPRWLARGSLCDTNFVVSTVPQEQSWVTDYPYSTA